ncbi:OLC1v1009927C1 [Oldenlandia corymbosa var. corymbosa]|uniref:OLC1v1009927C1 n=1 Tax=Oldenlandia corymbosa var. corymbosa TaxID=529605 RepID=A0AAV1DTC1_OLDCO|nr:OLC1v1009927C1 [Oldenlandia corymbosa var. corymbosa]
MALLDGKFFSTYGSKRQITLLLLLLFCTVLISRYCNPFTSWQNKMINFHRSALPSSDQNVSDSAGPMSGAQCDLFAGEWIPSPEGPYFTNASKCEIDDRQNCMKFGRPDTEFLKWRWKPHGCELPRFNVSQFLEIVRGKSMAFIGDSLARNQMQSLACILASEADPIDVSYTPDGRFKRCFYAEHNFTLAVFWSTHLVRSEEVDPLTSLMKLHLDEVDQNWAAEIENFSYVIFSAGQWFLRPLLYYQKGKLIGCYFCNRENIANLTQYYGYKMAFRTSFRTLTRLKNFKGMTILRTISPQHYENGEWNKGGNCLRKRPLGKQAMKLEDYMLEFYWTQLEELRAMQNERIKRRGLKFRVLNATQLMLLRADGHPNHYGHPPGENITIADCVHWCLPGPIDTWNEVLLQMLIVET